MADVVIHPNWVAGAADREAWDMAVVRLRDAGMGDAFPRVRIYGGPETPWTTTGGMFSIIGYGGGTGPGGVQDCAGAPESTRRYQARRLVRVPWRGDAGGSDLVVRGGVLVAPDHVRG